MFVDELKELQPNPGFMRLVKEHVLRAWEQRKAEVCHDVVEIEKREKAIRQKLDRLDEAFLFAQSIDIETYDLCSANTRSIAVPRVAHRVGPNGEGVYDPHL